MDKVTKIEKKIQDLVEFMNKNYKGPTDYNSRYELQKLIESYSRAKYSLDCRYYKNSEIYVVYGTTEINGYKYRPPVKAVIKKDGKVLEEKIFN